MRRQECFENWAALHDGRGSFSSEALESSWRRSESRAIDYARALPKDLTPGEIERSKKVYKRLMMCSDWALNHLVANSTEDELRVLLFSRDGVLLRVYGFITETDWLSSAGCRADGTRRAGPRRPTLRFPRRGVDLPDGCRLTPTPRIAPSERWLSGRKRRFAKSV